MGRIHAQTVLEDPARQNAKSHISDYTKGGNSIYNETATNSLVNDNSHRANSVDEELIKSKQRLPTVPIGKLSGLKSKINRIHTDRDELKRELMLIKERKPVVKLSALGEQDSVRVQLVARLEAGISALMGMEDKDLTFAT